MTPTVTVFGYGDVTDAPADGVSELWTCAQVLEGGGPVVGIDVRIFSLVGAPVTNYNVSTPTRDAAVFGAPGLAYASWNAGSFFPTTFTVPIYASINSGAIVSEPVNFTWHHLPTSVPVPVHYPSTPTLFGNVIPGTPFSSILLNWAPSLSRDPRFGPIIYDLERSLVGAAGPWDPITVPDRTATSRIEGPYSDGVYYFRVRGRERAVGGPGFFSNVVTVYLPGIPPTITTRESWGIIAA